MCYMCEENGGEPEYCVDCGVAICFDATDRYAWPEPAGVTSSGDLFCLRHAVEYDEEAEQLAEELAKEMGMWDFDPYDVVITELDDDVCIPRRESIWRRLWSLIRYRCWSCHMPFCWPFTHKNCVPF